MKEHIFRFCYDMGRPIEGGMVQLSVQETEKLLLRKIKEAEDDPIEALWELGRFYARTRQHEKSLSCVQQILARQPSAEQKAVCVLAMGQTMEQMENYEAAIRFYREALSLEPLRTDTWYFIHNNLGFCLNTQGKYEEAEDYCRRAIEIDPGRPNAHKNLGIALGAQGRLREAAQCFIAATRANASDPRASYLLTRLLADRPELQAEFGVAAECCRRAVALAAGEAEEL